MDQPGGRLWIHSTRGIKINTTNNKNQNEVKENWDDGPSSGTSEQINNGDSSEVPIITNHAGTGQNRHLSGAQRRKILRQKAQDEGRPIPKFGQARKDRRREGRRAGALPSQPDEEADQTGKRVASTSLETAAPDIRSAKKTRDTGSYAAAASSNPRVLLTCSDYLGGEIPVETCKLIRRAVVKRILDLEEGAFVPCFEESFPRKGALVFVCENKESAVWLEKEAEKIDLGIPSAKVRVVSPDEVKVTKVMVRLPKGVESAPDFLKLVRRQNGGVDTKKWAVLKSMPDGVLILGLDEPSVNTLKNRKFRLLAGVGKATFKVLDRSKPNETEGTGQEGTQRMEY